MDSIFVNDITNVVGDAESNHINFLFTLCGPKFAFIVFDVIKVLGTPIVLFFYTDTFFLNHGVSRWGKLKSGAGWISLDYAKRI